METKPTNMRLNPLEHVVTLDKVSVGMWVFDCSLGWHRVESVTGSHGTSDCEFPLHTHDGKQTRVFTADGKRTKHNKYPSLFLIDIFEGTNHPEPEVDWSKVPPGTPVSGENRDGKGVSGLFAGREYHVSKDATLYDVWAQNTYYRFEFCRLAVPVKPEWIKS